MAVLIAAGTTAATGTFTLAAGERKTVSINATGADVPWGVQVGIYLDGSGGDVLFDTLNAGNLTRVVDATGVFIVKRGDISQYGVSVAVDAD